MRFNPLSPGILPTPRCVLSRQRNETAAPKRLYPGYGYGSSVVRPLAALDAFCHQCALPLFYSRVPFLRPLLRRLVTSATLADSFCHHPCAYSILCFFLPLRLMLLSFLLCTFAHRLFVSEHSLTGDYTGVGRRFARPICKYYNYYPVFFPVEKIRSASVFRKRARILPAASSFQP